LFESSTPFSITFPKLREWCSSGTFNTDRRVGVLGGFKTEVALKKEGDYKAALTFLVRRGENTSNV